MPIMRTVPAALAAFLAVPATALGQEPAAEPDGSSTRGGWIVGFGMGGGYVRAECEPCGSGGALWLAFRLGGHLTHRLGLAYDFSVSVQFDDDLEQQSRGIHALALKAWLLPRVWLSGGVGLSQLYPFTAVDDEPTIGFGTTSAIGLELTDLPQGRWFILPLVLEAQLRLDVGFHDDHAIPAVAFVLGAAL